MVVSCNYSLRVLRGASYFLRANLSFLERLPQKKR
jgi:hypothetical protein